jgi:methionine sulfoxide reductase heme-binding subunit
MAGTVTATPPRATVRVVGWPLVGWAAAAVAVLSATAFLAAGGGAIGVHAVIRTTARTSLLLFPAAFIASSARMRWPMPLTRWLLANRRYVGVSFAASHTFHLLAIIAALRLDPDLHLAAPVLVGGGIAYVFIAAMTVTSFDRTAAWLGPRRWKLLHRTGMYWIWAIFAVSYVPRALTAPAYAPAALALLGALVLRAQARRRPAQTSQ